MPIDTHFSQKRLEKHDPTGKPCLRWLKAGKNDCTFICIVCNINELSCRNAGWGDIKKHFERPKHQQCMKDVFESAQLIISSTTSTAASSIDISSNAEVATTMPTSFLRTNSKAERVLTHEEKVRRAECIWAMTTARFGLSYNTSQFLRELMQSMFPDSKIAADLSMRSRKLSYVISHGTGHHFTMELIKDVRKAKAFSLLFDESTTTGVRKQCDLYFRYWSEAKNVVCTRYYKSIFLGHATTDIVSREIIDSLKPDGINIAHLLMLGRDNPNVNKTIEALIEKEVIAERKKQQPTVPPSGLMSIGSCPLHILHNSFRKGMTST
ncbi:unnamed protein product [Rotaria magnacalcarata]|uniref:Uncharacterized protein n=1 Tax=Rotaria magnacalcarata TaxID=392030 RepID=A0A816F716_9BILA|nr:unnamed protein product [Rotaria magnacalcarata]CAF1659499.1 unnamed protein product [Rotaria magnacalcarata]